MQCCTGDHTLVILEGILHLSAKGAVRHCTAAQRCGESLSLEVFRAMEMWH